MINTVRLRCFFDDFNESESHTLWGLNLFIFPAGGHGFMIKTKDATFELIYIEVRVQPDYFMQMHDANE